jgi:drug/metabolite transporter (DMT)-like permease
MWRGSAHEFTAAASAPARLGTARLFDAFLFARVALHVTVVALHRRGAPARVRADLALLGVTAIWGGTFVMVKDALAFAGPLTFVAVRFTIAALVLAPVVLLTSQRVRGGTPRGASPQTSEAPATPPLGLVAAGSLLGGLLIAGYAFQTAGLQFTSAGRAAFITGLSVVIVPLLAALVLRRRIAHGVWAGVALATVGLALLTVGPVPLDAAVNLGDLLVLGCTVLFAAHIVVVGEVAPRFDVLGLTLVQLVAAALLGWLLAVAFERPTLDQLVPILPAATFTGVFATVLAFGVQVYAQRFTTSTHTALIFSMEPVFGALFAFLIAGEVLTPPALIGCALILAGMLVAQLAE